MGKVRLFPIIHRDRGAKDTGTTGEAGRCCVAQMADGMEDRGLSGAMAQGAKHELRPDADLANTPDERRVPIQHEVEAHLFVDDGLVPNNGKLPLILYRHALALEHVPGTAERALAALFRSNGWRGAWVDGLYDFHHYHSTAHEVLGIAQGSAKVQLGGPQGLLVELEAGDAVAIPAGVGHCLIAGDDLVVVGAYPEGQDWDLCRATESDRLKALENIPWVPLPKLDPVFGADGPVLARWVD
jgi:uncharacterized protein YjlB